MADWAKLTTDYYLDAAVAALDDASEVLFTRGIAYAGQQETGGYVPAAVLPALIRRYTPARARKATAQLVDARLWMVVDGGWQIRSWERIQEHLDALAERRRADRERQARRRALSRDSHVTPEGTDGPAADGQNGIRNESRIESDTDHEPETNQKPTCGKPEPAGHGTSDPPMSRDSHVSVTDPEAEAEAGKEPKTPYLTLVSRLAGSNARDLSASLPAELIAEWQDIAGPLVDLEAEARAYIAHYADRPARNERSAWIGWLRRARIYAETNAPAPPCPNGCTSGVLGYTADERPIPCLHCRPHHVRAAS